MGKTHGSHYCVAANPERGSIIVLFISLVLHWIPSGFVFSNVLEPRISCGAIHIWPFSGSKTLNREKLLLRQWVSEADFAFQACKTGIFQPKVKPWDSMTINKYEGWKPDIVMLHLLYVRPSALNFSVNLLPNPDWLGWIMTGLQP